MVVISIIPFITSFIFYSKKLKKISATVTRNIPVAKNVRGGMIVLYSEHEYSNHGRTLTISSNAFYVN